MTNSKINLSELFSLPAITALARGKNVELLTDLETMYDDAFVYGPPSLTEDYNGWETDKRDCIRSLYRSINKLISITSKYEWGKDFIISVSDAFEIKRMFDNDMIYDLNEYLDVLEDIMMSSVHFKYARELGRCTKPEEVESRYKSYKMIKQILKGYQHPPWFYDVVVDK